MPPARASRRRSAWPIGRFEGWRSTPIAPARTPSDGNPNAFFDHTGSSYFYNANWYGAGPPANRARAVLGLTPWVLYGKRFDTIDNQSRQYSIADATIIHTWPYWSWAAEGPHGSEFNWHDRPENHPDALPSGTNLWFYDPKCNIGFLDGHVTFIELGPYRPGELSMNRDQYTIDPQWP